MDINDLIPKNKGDIKTAEKLQDYGYDVIKPIIPELLTWIQDMNWPVAGTVANYLESVSEHLTDEIVCILRGTDEVWKYWCVKVFGLDTEKSIAPKLMAEFKRIATNPTQQEIDEEVQELTIELLNKL